MSLVSTEWLEKNLKNVRIIDASWHMPSSKRNADKEFLKIHIENTVFFDLDKYSDEESSLPHMLPSNNPKKWGVKVFEHECDSVLNYMNILNNGGAYKKYRELRENGINDPYILVETLDAYAADKHYFSKIKSILTKIRSEYEVR